MAWFSLRRTICLLGATGVGAVAVILVAGLNGWPRWLAVHFRSQMHPDLVVSVPCPPGQREPSYDFWEAELSKLNFRVANPVALLRRMGIGDAVWERSLYALDGQERVVTVIASYVFRASDRSQSVALYSRPPTVRDPALEAVLERLLQSTGCTSSLRIQRLDNDAEASRAHRGLVRSMNLALEEADRIMLQGYDGLSDAERSRLPRPAPERK